MYNLILLGIHVVPNHFQLLTNSNIDLVSSNQCVYLNDNYILLNVIVQNRTNHENSVYALGDLTNL